MMRPDRIRRLPPVPESLTTHVGYLGSAVLLDSSGDRARSIEELYATYGRRLHVVCMCKTEAPSGR